MEYGPTFCGLLIISELYRNGRQYNNGKSENNRQSYKSKKSFGQNIASAYDKVLSRGKRYTAPSLETPSIKFSSSNVSVFSMAILLWSFQTGYTKLERFLHKNQHTHRKLLNFENWYTGELSKSAKIWFSVNFLCQIPSKSFSIFFQLKYTILGANFLWLTFFD